VKPTGNARPGRGRDGLDRPSRIRHSARVEETGRDWTRLKGYVISARVAAGYATREQFAKAVEAKVGYIATRTLGNVERGKSVSDSTLSAIELTLDWPPGTCMAILRGGEPPKLSTDENSSDDPDEELRNALRVLRRAIICTIIAASAWFIIWARHVRKELQDVRDEVQGLREERDVSEAMRRIRHLRVVGHDHRGDSHG
jgi:hypothetical protein